MDALIAAVVSIAIAYVHLDINVHRVVSLLQEWVGKSRYRDFHIEVPSLKQTNRSSLGFGCRIRWLLAVLLNDFIDQAVLLGLLSRHDKVALSVLLDCFD